MITALLKSAVAKGKALQLVTIKNNFTFINYGSFAVFISAFGEARVNSQLEDNSFQWRSAQVMLKHVEMRVTANEIQVNATNIGFFLPPKMSMNNPEGIKYMC